MMAMKKITYILSLLFTATSVSSAFIVPVTAPASPSTTTACRYTSHHNRTPSTFLCMANSDNIRAAMEATEQYGIHSSEARLAWEVVEEFDARTNDKAAYTPDENGLSKLTQDQIDNAYWELQQSIEFMQQNQYTGFNSLQNNQELMKDIAVELSAIKLSREPCCESIFKVLTLYCLNNIHLTYSLIYLFAVVRMVLPYFITKHRTISQELKFLVYGMRS